MAKAVEYFQEQIRNIRCGSITTSVVDTVRAECYGQRCPIKQVAWTIAEKNRICVDPYDPQLLEAVDRALKENGFNSYIFSKTRVVINLPPMSGEDRLKVIGRINVLAEETRVAIRNIRKKARQALDKEELKKADKSLQALTDAKIAEVDASAKEKINSLK